MAAEKTGGLLPGLICPANLCRSRKRYGWAC